MLSFCSGYLIKCWINLVKKKKRRKRLDFRLCTLKIVQNNLKQSIQMYKYQLMRILNV